MASRSILCKQKSFLLTVSVLLSLSAPVFAAETQASPVDTTVQTKDVVVTATRTAEEVKNVPDAMQIITQEDIQRLGATDIYSALALASNIDVRNHGVGHNLFIRGLSSKYALILIDGKRMANEDSVQLNNVYTLQRIPLSDVERIEIIRGAASAQYGADAVSGVINIITKKAQSKPTVTVGANTGTEIQNNYYHINWGKHGKFSATTDVDFTKVRRQNMPWDDPNSDDYIGMTYFFGPQNFYNFSGTYEFNDTNSVDVDASYLTERFRWTSIDSEQGTNYDNTRRDYSITYNGHGDNDSYMLRWYRSNLSKQQYSGVDGKDDPYFGNATHFYTIDAWEGHNTIVAGSHNITYGGEYRKTYIGGNALGWPSATRKETAGYIQDEWYVGDKLLLIPSIRYDHSNMFDSATTPKLGVTYFMKPNSRLKMNVGKAFRAPTITELYGSVGGGSMVVNGNLKIRPEKANVWDISYEGEFGGTSGKVTYYHNRISDYINAFDEDDGSITYKNVDGVISQGVELEVNRKFNDNWTLTARKNWTNVTKTDYNPRYEFTNKLYNHPASVTILQLTYDDNKEDGFSATIWNQWIHDYLFPGDENGDFYYSPTFTNLSINKRLGNGKRIFLAVDNIFDKKIKDMHINGRVWRLGTEITF